MPKFWSYYGDQTYCDNLDSVSQLEMGKAGYFSACTSGRFRPFYTRNWLPYAENSKVGRTLTSPLNLVCPSAISVT